MPAGTELIVADGQFAFHKTMLSWRRALRIELRPVGGGPGRRLDFPADRFVLTIDGLDPGTEYEIAVRRQGLLAGLRHGPRRLRARPAARRLRAIVTGSGRCGTTSLARWLDGLRFRDGSPVRARHETLPEHVLPLIEARGLDDLRALLRGLPHDIEVAPFLALVPEVLDAEIVVHLVRDGRRVVQSGLNRGWYRHHGQWNRIKPDFGGDPFEGCCRFWVHVVRKAARAADHTFRLEDVVADPGTRRHLLGVLRIEVSDRPFPVSNRGRDSSAFAGWGADRREQFTEICGATMDDFYPGWRSQW